MQKNDIIDAALRSKTSGIPFFQRLLRSRVSKPIFAVLKRLNSDSITFTNIITEQQRTFMRHGQLSTRVIELSLCITRLGRAHSVSCAWPIKQTSPSERRKKFQTEFEFHNRFRARHVRCRIVMAMHGVSSSERYARRVSGTVPSMRWTRRTRDAPLLRNATGRCLRIINSVVKINESVGHTFEFPETSWTV